VRENLKNKLKACDSVSGTIQECPAFLVFTEYGNMNIFYPKLARFTNSSQECNLYLNKLSAPAKLPTSLFPYSL